MENYYSWYTVALVNQPVKNIVVSASANTSSNGIDDDDLKIVIDGQAQKKESNSHKYSYFCGFNLRGKTDIFSREVKFNGGTHLLELFADQGPVLKEIKIIRDQALLAQDPLISVKKFNPHYVIKDSAFVNDEALSEEEIEEFIRSYGERHPNHLYYQIFDRKKASYWIKKYACEIGINPKIILCKLQIEGHLIMGDESINPAQDQYDWALGVGKTDYGTLPEYKGFLVQIKSASVSFRNLFKEGNGPPFIVEGVDNKKISVINRATAAFYHYTSHVEGADLFYRLYSEFFGDDDLGGQT